MRPTPILVAAFILAWTGAASADPFVFYQSACGGPGQDWLCIDAASTSDFETTVDAPERDFAFTLQQPEDLESWRLGFLRVHGLGSAGYTLVFDEPGAWVSAQLREVSILDAAGRVLLSQSRSFETSCRNETSGPFAGSWVCSGGDSLGAQSATFGALLPANDPALPSLDGPWTLHVDWIAPTDAEPELSRLAVRNVSFSYVYERVPSPAVPEPSAALLYAAGLVTVTAARRRAITTAP